MVAVGDTRAPRRGVDRALLAIEAIAGIAVVAAIVGKSYGFAPTLFFIFASFAATFTGWAVVRAIASWRDESLDITGRIRDTEREALEQEKLILLQGIKELEADLAVGKVDKRDYDYLRRTAEARAIVIIEKLKEWDRRWMGEAEHLVRSRLGASAAGVTPLEVKGPAAQPAPAAGAFAYAGPAPGVEPADPAMFDDRPVVLRAIESGVECAACNAKSDADARFCTGCGRPKEAA